VTTGNVNNLLPGQPTEYEHGVSPASAPLVYARVHEGSKHCDGNHDKGGVLVLQLELIYPIKSRYYEDHQYGSQP